MQLITLLPEALRRIIAAWWSWPLSFRFVSAGVALAVLLPAVALVLSEESSACNDRFCVEVLGVAGEEVDPMTPLRIRLRGDIDRDAALAALQIEPAATGTAAFEDDVLTFRPDWPGFARGVDYGVKLSLAEAHLPRGVPAVDLAFDFTVTGRLEVASVFPADLTSEVVTDAEVYVQFNRSVAPLTVIDAQAPDNVLTFDPPVAGAGRWLNTSLFVFAPVDGWQPATDYTGRVVAGLTNELGARLDEDFVFHFSTVSPAVEDVSPAANTKFVAPADAIRVAFNQPVDAESAQARFSLTLLTEERRTLEGSFEWTDNRTLLFWPAEPLPFGARVEALLAAGIAAPSGKATAAETRWSFETVGLPRVVSTSPQNGSENAGNNGASITFATPMDRQSVEDAITVEPAQEDAPRFFWDPSDLTLHVTAKLEPSKAYRIGLSTEARDRYGNQLSEPLDLRFTTDRVRPIARIFRSGQSGTFNAYLDRTVMVSSWNVERLEFKLYHLDRNQFIELQTRGGRGGSYGEPVREWSHSIENPPLNQPVVTEVRLDQGSRLAEGFYVISMTVPGGDPTSPGPRRDPVDELPFLISSVNLTTKWSGIGENVLVWAVDLQTGVPYAGWGFDVLDGGGNALASGATDASGLALIDVASPGDNYFPGYFVAAERDGRVAFASTTWNDGISPYSYGSGINFDFTLPELVGNIYTDRPIYRPGETVYLKGVVREDDDASYSLPEGLQLEVRIDDEQGRRVDSQTVTLSDMGSFDTSLALSAEASTGMYHVSLLPPETPERGRFYGITGVSFRIAEFRKPEFEVTVTTDQESYVNGEQINATVSAQLFFGAPLANAAVQWRVTGSRYTFRSDKFSQFQTGEYQVFFGCMVGSVPTFEPQRFFRLEGSGRTDEQGLLRFSAPADVAGDIYSQSFTVEAWVTDENQQQVSDFRSVPIHKGRFYVGMKPEDYAPRAGSETSVSLVSLDPLNGIVPDVGLNVSVYERKWRTVRERGADGQQQYRSESEDILVEELSAGTGADGLGSFRFTPPRAGQYYVVARAVDDRGNTVQSSLVLWVSGQDYASWHVPNDDRFTLVLDKDEYRPGEVARILVAAPFEGESIALVSQERGKLLAYETRRVAGNSEVLELPIVDRHLPNFYLSVVLFKPPTADNPLPQVKFGLVQVKVVTEDRRLNIEIEPSAERLGPRQEVTYNLRTTDKDGNGVPAELSLALVDKAVLSLQDDLSRPGLSAFWSTRPLGVLTASTYALSIDRANQLAKAIYPGGKGGGGGLADQTRTFFPNTAFWDPAFRTGPDGRGSVTVTLPDTLTTWRLTARGITTGTRVGEAQNEIVTSQDLIVRPVLPRFLVANDEARIGAIVNNLSEVDLTVDVSLNVEGLEIAQAASQSVQVAAGGSAPVYWTAKAPLSEGQSTLSLAAEAGDRRDAVSLGLPVYAYYTPETVATGGEVEDRANEAIFVPSYVLPDAGGLTVNLTPSIAAGVEAGYRYLREYSYESAEMTVSRFVAALALERAVNELGLEDIDKLLDDTRPLVQRALQKLYATQKRDGGWGWWPAENSDPAMTAYVLAGLGEAKRAGYDVDGNVEARAGGYLMGELDRGRDVQRQELDLRAFILYGLARDQRGDLGRTYALAEQRVNLSNKAKAWLAQAIRLSGGNAEDPRLTTLLGDLQDAAVVSATGAHWQDDGSERSMFSGSTAVTAQVLRAFTALQPDHPLVDNSVRWLMVARNDGRWECSYDTAMALLAITDYLLDRRDVQEAYAYDVSVNGESRLEASAGAGRINQEERVTIDMAELTQAALNDLVLSRVPGFAQGRLYYTAQLRYFTPSQELEARNEGIGVSHEYFRADSDDRTPVNEVQLGDLVKVKLTLVAPADLNYLVVEDFLPAGLEPVDTSLKITPVELRNRLFQERRESYEVNRRYSPFGHAEVRDNRVALFARFVGRGVYEYTYFARATTAGSFNLPPATAYEQYFPEVFGRSDGSEFIVRAE
jgi:uncharacterized protein YfaS (alpha-2-macroglobulin family)